MSEPLATDGAAVPALGVTVLPLRTPTLPPATHTNAVLLGGRELMLVEPASPYPEELEILWRTLDARLAGGARLVRILLTHHHPDHVGGLEAVRQRHPEVPVAAHAETAALLPTGSVDELVGDGSHWELAVGEGESLEVQAIHTPGHAPGHLCLLMPQSRILVAGDMVAGTGTILIPPDETGDMSQYIASLQRLAALAPSRLIPAHGPIINEGVSCLHEYVNHRRRREQQVITGLADGPASALQLVPGIYTELPEHFWQLASLSLLAHLLDLERHGRVARDNESWRLVDGGS